MTQDKEMTTAELAQAIRGKPESIRIRLCREGSYYGVVPKKLPNGRLLWPADTLDRLVKIGGEKEWASQRPERRPIKQADPAIELRDKHPAYLNNLAAKKRIDRANDLIDENLARIASGEIKDAIVFLEAALESIEKREEDNGGLS